MSMVQPARVHPESLTRCARQHTVEGQRSRLVNHTMTTETGTWTRNTAAITAATNICRGTGIQLINSPTATPPATERRFRCHTIGCAKVFRIQLRTPVFSCSQPPRSLCSMQRTLFASGSLCLSQFAAIVRVCRCQARNSPQLS